MSVVKGIRRVEGVEGLLSLWDEEFVDAAYTAILGRAPDEPGRAHHVHSIRTGVAKCEILRRIRESPEGHEAGADVPGLDDAIRKHRQSSKTLGRRLLRFISGAKKFDARERARRALENQLHIGNSTQATASGVANAPIGGGIDPAILDRRILADEEAIRDLRRRMVRMETILNRLDQSARKSQLDQGRLARHG